MIEEIEGTQYTCDGCGKSVYKKIIETTPPGYRGSIREIRIEEDGENWSFIREWYACTRECLVKAIETVSSDEVLWQNDRTGK